MYLEHFKFNEMPFALTPNTEFFCQLKGHEEALNVLLYSLRSGEGFIKIIGEVGSGKTLLCRKLLDILKDEFMTAFIHSPDLNPNELRRAFAREIGIDLTDVEDQHELVQLIQKQLLKLHKAGKKMVLLIDEAQALPPESLETIRLLTNIETEKNKLWQVVLFGQPELDQHLVKPNLRQLEQRITFTYYLPLMTREELDVYLFHRLTKAGYQSGSLFGKKACDSLFQASKGVPRIINILCHKSLLVAFGRNEKQITRKIMQSAILDTPFAAPIRDTFFITLGIGMGCLLTILLLIYCFKGII